MSVLHPEFEELKPARLRPGQTPPTPDRVAFLEARKRFRYAAKCRSWNRDLGRPVTPEQERPRRGIPNVTITVLEPRGVIET